MQRQSAKSGVFVGEPGDLEQRRLASCPHVHGKANRFILLRPHLESVEPRANGRRIERAADRLYGELCRLGLDGMEFSRNTAIDIPGRAASLFPDSRSLRHNSFEDEDESCRIR